MVECEKLDVVFGSLADATRRDILKRVTQGGHSISELAKPYEGMMSFAGIAKHVDILESAGLVKKRKKGKFHIISFEPKAFRVASLELEKYAHMWNKRFDALDQLLKNTK